MKRALLVAFYGAASLPLGAALWFCVELLRAYRPPGASIVMTPFLDWNGHHLPFWPCLAGVGAASALALYGLMCALFRIFK